MFRHSLFIIALFLFSIFPVYAEDNTDVHGILAIAKFTGACGVMDSMINLQETTKLEGGDEFVLRFWKVEAARLGMTVQEFSKQCDDAVEAYNKLWNLAEE